MTELKDRYVAAVLRAIPEDQRSDVDTELRAAIDDAIDGRIEQGQNLEDAQVEVLNELGDPDRLAAEYSGKPLWVIGPRYYLAWLRMTKRLLTIIPPLVGVIVWVVRYATETGFLDAFWSGVWAAWIAAVNVVFWTAIGFVITERVEYSSKTEVIPLGTWKVDYLPRVPDRQIGVVETIGAVVIQLLVISVLVVLLSAGEISILNPDLWDLAIPAALVLMIVSLVFSLIKFWVGRWTMWLAILNGLLNAAFTALWYWILITITVLDPETTPTDWNTEDWLTVTSVITVAVIAAVCTWDTIEGFQKARKGLAPPAADGLIL